jgi:tetraacyldisaccharide 4'-kinase
MDDAFQHRYVKPGINILLTTFSRPYFNDYLIPVGLLRERLKGAERADLIIVTKCPKSLSPIEVDKYMTAIHPHKYQKVFFTYESYTSLQRVNSGKNELLAVLKQKKVVLITGIANAASILEFVKNQSQLIKHYHYPDHHGFSEKELDAMLDFSAKYDQKDLIFLTTEKDVERLRVLNNFGKFADSHSYTLPLSIKFYEDQEEAFLNRIINYVESNK